MSGDVTTKKGPSFGIPASVLYREVDQQMVLLNLESEQYYGLDQVGAHILGRIIEDPFEDALAALEREYEVDREVLHRDVENLVAALIAAGLLERRAR